MGEDRANSSNEAEGGKRCAWWKGMGSTQAPGGWGGGGGERGGAGTRENREGLKSSRDAPREETLKMTQFITITATKEWEEEGREGGREGARRGEK